MTHLRGIYEFLAADLEKTGRRAWLDEEIATLTDPRTYTTRPEDAWRRVKTRTNSGRFMALVQALAAFREGYAQTNNVPRSRVFKDDALIELASTKPRNEKDLGRSRLLLREARKGDIAAGILEAINSALALPSDALPKPDKSRDKLQVNPALADLLRVLLKAKAEQAGVAQKLIATSADLDGLAAGLRDSAALSGWRKDVFGSDALDLCDGKIGLRADKGRVVTVSL